MGNGNLNLEVARGPRSVWDEPGWQTTLADYDQERWLAAAGGVAMALAGARRGGVTGGLTAAAGAILAVRAAMGRRDLRVARDWVDATLVRTGWREADPVHETSEESFPASDSPSWTPTTGTSRR